MTHEFDHQHTSSSSSSESAAQDADQHPGRASRSALMRKPDQAIISGLVSRKSRDANGVTADAEHAVGAAACSSGAPLPESLMRKFESSLGADLGGVRVHTGEASAAANDAVGARAYTIGQDIHFGAGQYDPSSGTGEHLLAHEVAHTVQQGGGAQRMQFKLAVSSPGDSHEHEADAAAASMVSGQVARVSFGSGVARKVMRDAAPAPAKDVDTVLGTVPKHTLTKQDKTDLEWCKTVAGKAYSDYNFSVKALGNYASKAPIYLERMQSTFEKSIAMYKKQFEGVNSRIEKAKENAALRDEILVTLIVGTFTAVVGMGAGMGSAEKLTELCEEKVSEGYRELASELWEKVGEGAELSDKTGLTAGLKKTAGMGSGGEGPTEDPIDKELAFYKQFSALQAQSAPLLSIAVKLAAIGPALGGVKQKVADTIASGSSDPKYSVARMHKQAAGLQSGASSMADAAESVPQLLADLAAMSAFAAAAAPRDPKEVEKEIWVKWAANLDKTDKDTMDLDVVERHLKEIGIWDQLGIDPGNFFSDSDQTMAVCSANAQSRVLEHKGETVTLTNGAALSFGGMSLGTSYALKVGDLPMMGAVVDGVLGQTGKAIVTGARSTGKIPKDILDKVKGKEAITDYLLANHYITIVTRPYDVPTTEELDSSDG